MSKYSRYIDAEELKHILNASKYYGTKAGCDFADMITECDTADVVEIKHGRWVMDENPHDGDCRCSVCTIVIDQMHERNHGLLNSLTGGKWWTFYRYCPNCGTSMMDEECKNENC